MISLGANELMIVLLLIFIMLLFLSVFNSAKSLEESKRNRIKDLLVAGLILWFSPSAKIAGVLIFLYGFGILLYEKYQEGKREVVNST